MSDVLMYSWVLFMAIVAANRYLRGERVSRRAPGTWLGIAIQAAGFSLVWMSRAWPLFAALAFGVSMHAALDWVGSIVGALSILLALSAIWFLGRNWSVAARILDDHRLVTEGPYRFVRHPVYTAMFGMLLATGLSFANPAGLLLGSAVFLAGTAVRIHFEERLLREHFGEEFDRWAATVPAFLPLPRTQPKN